MKGVIHKKSLKLARKTSAVCERHQNAIYDNIVVYRVVYCVYPSPFNLLRLRLSKFRYCSSVFIDEFKQRFCSRDTNDVCLFFWYSEAFLGSIFRVTALKIEKFSPEIFRKITSVAVKCFLKTKTGRLFLGIIFK